MLIIGIIVLLIASILRAWGLLNYKRSPGDLPLVFLGASGKLRLSIFTTVSIILGLVGAIFIGYTAHFLVGLLAFVSFWFLSGIWVPLLEFITMKIYAR